MNKWDDRMVEVARLVSTWSKDAERKVGCVITTEDYHILATGFNGYPKNVDDTDPSFRLHKSIHAEVNAALRLPRMCERARVFVWGGHPCAQCAAVLLQKGCRYFYVPKILVLSKWSESMFTAYVMIKNTLTGEIGAYNTYDNTEEAL